jgi:hypothetical protein
MMEKLIYIEPRLKALLFDEEPVLVDGTYPEIDEDDEGEDLSKKNAFDDSDFPCLRSVWDED